jgi:hypothetical protein
MIKHDQTVEMQFSMSYLHFSKVVFVFVVASKNYINRAEPVFVNLLRSPDIDSQPGNRFLGIDSWAPYTFTNSGSGILNNLLGLGTE